MSKRFNHTIVRVKNSEGKFESLPALRGQDPYEVAVAAGFTGTKEEWLQTVIGNGWVESFNNLEATVATKAAVKYFTGTLLADGWTGTSSPFSQEITVNGILETDKPKVDMVASDTYATAETEIEAWGYVYRVVTSQNGVTAYATEKPEVSLNIQIEVIR